MSKPSPLLQPRLLPSMITTGLVALLLFTIFAGNLAHAAELDSILPDDHNHERLLDPFVQLPVAYEIPNNIARPYNLNQGETMYFVFLNETVWGPHAPAGSGSTGLPSVGLSPRWEGGGEGGGQGALNTADGEESSIHKRANATRTVYITLNTCLQPSNAKGSSGPQGPPPQLTMYVGDNQTALGASQPADGQLTVAAEFGFANLTFDASKDVYIAVKAPNTTEYEGVYNVEVGVSIDAPFHSYSGDAADLFFIDSVSSTEPVATVTSTLDNSSSPVYQKWMQLSPPPYVIFANQQNQMSIQGVSRSYCGLENYAQIAGTQKGLRTDMVKTIMTNVTLGTHPKQQFYFQGLSASSQYYGILALPGNATERAPGGGGRMATAQSSSTSPSAPTSPTSCPGNPTTFPTLTSLAEFYDNAAASAYSNFAKALQQIPCEIPNTGQYSLVRNCDHCAAAYKAWLCSDTIAPCQDYSRSDPWLQPRNVVQPFPNSSMLQDSNFLAASQEILYLNSSRNPAIDEIVKPGPYKEILPCLDMCYNLVQSCPAAMGFECPGPGNGGFASSYGRRPNGSSSEDGQITL
ncbi:hypothetical protein VE04_01336 [Pseudogymnoascus sp. 24MN13]|nr:hypothetical protein VE04_01336 [Pseudogymnoascus sp. 24MN13]